MADLRIREAHPSSKPTPNQAAATREMINGWVDPVPRRINFLWP